MSIALIDINALTATISQDKDLLLPVVIPNGSGAFTDPRKLKKEDLFKLLEMAIEMTTAAGANDVIIFDPTDVTPKKLIYVNSGGGGFRAVMANIGVSSDGTANQVQMSSDGSLRAGTASVDGLLTVFEDAVSYEFTGRDLAQQCYTDLDIQDAGTSTAIECRTSIMALGVDSLGTIAAHEIVFPSQARPGYTFEVSILGTVTALTITAGIAVTGPSFTTATNEGAKWVRGLEGAVPFWQRLY